MQHRPSVKRFITGILIPAALILTLCGCYHVITPASESITSHPTTEQTSLTAETTTGQTPSSVSSAGSSSKEKETEETTPPSTTEEAKVKEDEEYSSRDEVALYIHLYGHLPSNYITKKEARALGWEGGSLEPYAPGKAIGGDKFGNYEGNLPDRKGVTYHECDIDTVGKKSRGAKRIVFSDDGYIYYTEDHYETFTLLYGE